MKRENLNSVMWAMFVWRGGPVALFLFGLMILTVSEAAGPASEDFYRQLNSFRARPFCDSRPLPALPPLKVNPKLEEAARLRASDTPLGEAMERAGYRAPYAKVLAVGGGTAKQSMDRLVQRYCDVLADKNYAEAGAVFVNERWWLVMAYGQSEAPPAEALTGLGAEAKKEDPMVMLELVNLARSQARVCGDRQFAAARPLSWNQKLAGAAMKHSKDMASRRQLSHTGSDGSDVSVRVEREGYRYRAVGENVSMNPFGIEAAMKAWLGSPGHCSNIMNQEFTEMGAAFEAPYGTQVFGRSGVGP